MTRVSLNHWYVNGNKLEISLMWFFVSIDVDSNGCLLTVVEDGVNKNRFRFTSLEDAIDFTEEFIASCKDIDMIKETYQIITHKDDKEVILDPCDIDQALIEYFSEGKDYRVSVKEELSIENNHPKIDFYLIEHLKYGDEDVSTKTLLTEGDLLKAFNHFVKDIDYEVKDFKYIGGIHRAGYYFDEDTPHFEGIELRVVEREKVLTK